MAAAVRDVVAHARTMAQLQARLAVVELRRKLLSIGLGVALALAAAVCLLGALGLASAGAAAGIATALPVWAALLLVAAAYALVAATLLIVAVGLLRRGSPPVPEQAIAEAIETDRALSGDGRGVG